MLPGLLPDGNFATLARAWRDYWNNYVLDHVRGMTLIPGHGISIQRRSAGTIISVAGRAGGNGGASGADSADTGPFDVALTAVEDGSTRVKLYNSASNSGITGMVTLGSYREEIADQSWPASAGVVIMDVTVDDDDQYQIQFALASAVPATADERRYILRIAEIIASGEGFRVAMIRPPGDIEVTGRWLN